MKRKHSHTRTVSTVQNSNIIKKHLLNSKPPSERYTDAATARVLLLGTEESGKTSIFKQIRRFCGDHPVSGKELSESKKHCIEHLVSIIEHLAQESINLTLNGHRSTIVNEKNEWLLVKYSGIGIDTHSRDELWNAHTGILALPYADGTLLTELEALLKDPGIQATASYMKDFLLTSNCEWFLSKRKKYFDGHYTPDFNDYVRLHERHMRGDAIVDEVSRLSSSWNLSITDVCGQRSQRTLWASVMDNDYTAILYVVSLSDFDYVSNISKSTKSGGRHSMNRLIESMELLQCITSLSYFEKTNVILIFNKKDVFDKKLQEYRISFAKHFPIKQCRKYHWKAKDGSMGRDGLNGAGGGVDIDFDHRREHDPSYCIEIIKQHFTLILPPSHRRTLRIYITCAIATDTFGFVLQTMTQEVIHMEQMRKVAVTRALRSGTGISMSDVPS